MGEYWHKQHFIDWDVGARDIIRTWCAADVGGCAEHAASWNIPGVNFDDVDAAVAVAAVCVCLLLSAVAGQGEWRGRRMAQARSLLHKLSIKTRSVSHSPDLSLLTKCPKRVCTVSNQFQ